MERLNSLKSSGTKKLQSKKYTDAIIEFTQVVDALAEPASEEEISLKSTCLLNRATCNLLLCQRSQKSDEQQSLIQKSIDDAQLSIATLNKNREEEKTFENLVKNKKYDELKVDAHTHLFALSNLRLGEAHEVLAMPSKAFNYYSIAYNSEFDPANPKGNRNQEAKKAIRELLVRFYNAPDVKPGNGNSILQDFFVIKNEIARKEIVQQKLMDIFMPSYNGAIPDGVLKTIDSSKYCNLLYAIIELYDDQQMNIQASFILHFFVTHQFKSVFADYLIFKRIFEHSFSNLQVLNQFVQCLSSASREFHPLFLDNGFIPLVMKTFEFGDKISNKDIDHSFQFLYRIVEVPSRLPFVLENFDDGNQGDVFNPPIVKYIEERKTKVAACLLFKLSQDRRVLQMSELNHDQVWIREMLNEISESKDPDAVAHNSLVIFSSISYFSRLLLLRTDEENANSENNLEISELFDTVLPIAKKVMKSHELVSACFSFFVSSAPFITQKVIDNKVIAMASLYLHMNADYPIAVQNILSFIYEAADNPKLIDQVKKACPMILDNVMIAVQKHIQQKIIVERGVAIGCLLDHPNKKMMLEDSLDRFPNDEFLLKIKKRFETNE